VSEILLFVIPACLKPESRPAPSADHCVAGFRLKACRNDALGLAMYCAGMQVSTGCGVLDYVELRSMVAISVWGSMPERDHNGEGRRKEETETTVAHTHVRLSETGMMRVHRNVKTVT
jgi:hypothetical protein